MGKVTDKSRVEFYDRMIDKREREIAELQKKSPNVANTIRCVNRVTVHQNVNKSLGVHFGMNGDFSNSTTIILELEF